MAPFDRPYATFYWSACSAIVNIALSRTSFELIFIHHLFSAPAGGDPLEFREDV